MTSSIRRPLLVAIGTLCLPSVATADVEHVCTLGDTLRRVEVQFVDGKAAPPCEVAYIKETERPGRRAVLWTAEQDAAFCRGRAEDLISRLERHGWECRPPVEIERTEVADADPTRGPEPVAEESPPENLPPAPPAPSTREEQSIAAATPAPKPSETAPSDDAAMSDLAAAPAAEPGEDGNAGRAEAAVNGVIARAVDEPDADLTRSLEDVLARDLARLKSSPDDAVEASIEGFGDLNGDARDDAAVLITFDAEGQHSQYLVAYVAEQQGFRAAASRFIGGRHRKVFGADGGTIEDGRIMLELQVLSADDAYCCPSGSGTALFALKNGELVDIQ